MQFQHADGFRSQVRDLLLAEWPDAYDEWVRLGAEPISFELPTARPVAPSCAPVGARTNERCERRRGGSVG